LSLDRSTAYHPALGRVDPLPRDFTMSLFRALLIALITVGLLSACDDPPQPTVNLYRAVQIGDLDQIKRHLFWKTDINRPGPDGNYPLHVAVSQGRVAIARELLKHGAQVDLRNAQGRTPLHVALANGKVPAAELLREHGADDDLQSLLFALAEEQTLDRDTLEFLTSRGADINARDPRGQPPLHTVVEAGDVKLAKHLINAGAEVNRTDASGRTPLEIAAQQDGPTMMTLLEQYGATRQVERDDE
jgi:ankyrin repeat protein